MATSLRSLSAFAAIFVMIVLPQQAAAWGETGHRAVGSVAYSLLSDRARGEVDKILASNAERTKPQGKCAMVTLADAAQWPDCMRGWGNWDAVYSSNHFDNVPFCRKSPPGGYCKDGCATARLEKSIRQLKDPNVSPREKAEALGWIAHLIGDIHQPLHVVDDMGGNGVWVQTRDPEGTRRVKLHSYWDTFLVEHDDQLPGAAQSTRLSLELVEGRTLDLAKSQRTAWSGGAFPAWMKESHQMATAFAYTQVASTSACLLPHGKEAEASEPSAAYQHQAQMKVREQLAKAAVRLASLLDQTLG